MTVSGHPVAELHPARRQRWVSGPALDAIWNGPTPTDPHGDRSPCRPAQLGGGLVDPIDEWRQLDLGIAATAQVEGVPLLTYDVADFRLVADPVEVRGP